MAAECGFCQPEELESRIINNSSELMFSFLSTPRLSKGHSLVVPRRHVEPGRDELTIDEIVAIEREAERLRRVMLGLGYAGVDSFQKTRPLIPEGANGTKMDHHHQHVIPSSPGTVVYEQGLAWGHRASWHVLAESERVAMREALSLR